MRQRSCGRSWRNWLAAAGQWGFQVEKKEKKPGVTVKEVLAGSAAAAGGLRAGDRLLSLNGYWTESVADCYRATRHVKAGTAVKVVIERKGKEMTLTVKPVAGL